MRKDGPSFLHVGLAGLAQHVFSVPAISARLQSDLLNVVSATRNQMPTDPSMKAILSLLYSISRSPDAKDSFPAKIKPRSQKHFYSDYFEDALIAQANSIYFPMIATWQNYTTCEYLREAARQVETECEHTKLYLPESTLATLREEMQNTLMNSPEVGGLRGILTRANGGVLTLVDAIPASHPTSATEQFEALQTIFRISLCRKDACDLFANLLEEHMKRDARNITDSPDLKKDTKTGYVDHLLKLKDKYEAIVRLGMRDHRPLKEHMDKVFPEIIRALPQSEVATHLAIHFNALLKSADTTEAILSQAICVLQYLKEKDIFENAHRRHMKRRLLMVKMGEDQRDLEQTLIALIRPIEDTNTMELMFKDYKSAIVERSNWVAYASSLKLPLTFSALTLNTSRWTQEPLGMIFPPMLQAVADQYAAWYNTAHSGRKLNWTSVGTAEVAYRPQSSSYQLHLDSTPQVITLLQFNDETVLSAETIAANIGSTVAVVTRFLTPFCASSIAVLIKKENEYHINPKFKNSRSIVKIPMGARAVAAEDKAKTVDEITSQRQFQARAAIVRVMKTQKALNYQELQAQVMTLLQRRFTPTPQLIKNQIEYLIQNDYLQRAEGNHSLIEYKA